MRTPMISTRWLASLVVLAAAVCPRLAAAGTASMTPDPLATGSVVVGQTGTATGNLSDSALEVVNLVVDASCSGVVSVSPSTNIDLTTSSKSITATFAPAARGAISCPVVVDSKVTGSPVGSFTVTGTGVAPVATITPASPLAFGSARVSGGAITSTVTITNGTTDAGQDLQVTALGISGADTADFTLVSPPSLPATIAPGGTLQLTVTFDPTASGSRTAQLDVTTNDPINPMQAEVLDGTGTNGVLSVTDVALGTVLVGTTVTGSISLSNTASAPVGPVTVTSASMSQTSGWFSFAAGSGCTAGATSCTFSPALAITSTPAAVGVRCAPPVGASGSASATVTFASDTDPGGTSVSTLTCTAGAPHIAVDMTSLAFGNVAVGSTSSPQIVTVSNTGNEPLHVSLALGGTSPAMFAASTGSSCGAAASPCAIAPGGMLMLSVTFSPTAPNAQSAVLQLTSDDPTPGASPTDVALGGTGTAPDASASPASLAFGAVDVGTTSTAQTVTITNTGNATLTISNAAFAAGAADYTATAGTLGAQTTTVAPGGMVAWSLACKPSAPGSRPGTFQVTSDAFTNPTLDVALSCTGQEGILTISPASQDFGGVRVGDTQTATFTLSNTGNAPVTNVSLVLVGSAAYTVTSPAFPIASLAPSATQTVTVQFAPAAAGTASATATFSGAWGAAGSTSTMLGLTGQGLAADYDASPSPLAFGNVRFDQTASLPLDIVDTGAAQVTIESLVITPGTAMTGEFTVTGCTHGGVAASTPFTLTGMNDTLICTVKVAPADRAAALSATLTVHSDLPTNPDRAVMLTATATSGMLAATPGLTVDFGAVDMQAAAPTTTVTLTNTGNAPLDLGAGVASGSTAFTFGSLAGTTLQPGDSLPIAVTYTPTVARPAGQDDTASVTFAETGDVSETSVTVQLQGRGITRVLSLGAPPLFPDTFRNPGDAAPVVPVTITNTGEAALHLTAVMVTGDPVWQLVGPTSATLAQGQSFAAMIRFAPAMAGPAPAGQLQLASDDPTHATVMVQLTGTGLDRAVAMTPPVIDLGYTGVGQPVRLSEVAPGELLSVASMDSAHAFQIRSITLDGDDVFAVEGPGGGAPANLALAPGATRTFDVVFTPTAEGTFTATATLFLDQDPTAQASVMLQGHAVYVDAHGGGGCAAGGGEAGGGAVLALALLVVVVRRRRAPGAAAALVLIGALAFGASARAEPGRDLDVSVFEPTPSTSSTGFEVQGATVGASGDFVATTLVSYASDPLVLGSTQGEQLAIQDRTTFLIGGAYAFLGRFELGALLPLYVQHGQSFDPQMMAGTPGISGTARGDLTLHGRAGLWQGHALGGDLAVALGGTLTLPTASADELAGVAKPEGRLLALAQLAPTALDGKLVASVNAGAVLRGETRFFDVQQGSGATFGVGASYHLLAPMWLDAEVFGDIIPGGKLGMAGGTSALVTSEYLAGMHYQLVPTWDLGVALGRGLVAGIGAPAFRGLVMLTFSPRPAAGGGLAAPAPERDRDGDGIPDDQDKCPDQPEDKDMFQDQDGCPDLDNDGDGIPDDKDKCPLDPEDKDGFQDADGCPDKDNDGDGIPDDKDKCPDQPEDKDGFQDLDGCPDPDNDGDGIPDDKDRCPNDPETINGVQDDDGCPDKGDPLVLVGPDRLELLQPIRFRGARLLASSFNVLGQVGATLRAHKELVRVRITAYVQPTGDSDRDQALSDKRAQAIDEWLVQWGVDPKRLEPRGFGSDKPLVPASDPSAAAVNNRIELIILEKE